jgi:hypothetical protein
MNTAQMVRGLGNGRFSETPEPLPPLSLLQQVQLKLRWHMVSAELTGDGVMDGLWFRGNWVDVALGTGNGEQAPTVTVYAPGFEDALPLDMDGDCLPELVHPSQQGFAVLKLMTR